MKSSSGSVGWRRRPVRGGGFAMFIPVPSNVILYNASPGCGPSPSDWSFCDPNV